MYDSTADTIKHQETVRGFLIQVIEELVERQIHHDESKLEEPEKSIYDEFTPLLKDLTYGSDEYRETIRKMADGVKHHYENNSHHPEHYPNGINGMSLLDLIEMVADWKAAGMRHSSGNMEQSLEVNRKRFGISDQLFEVIQNTVREMGW